MEEFTLKKRENKKETLVLSNVNLVFYKVNSSLILEVLFSNLGFILLMLL